MEEIVRQNSLHEAGVHIRDYERAPRAGGGVRRIAVGQSPSYLALPGFISWDISYGFQTTIPSTRSKSLSLVAISRIRQRLIADR